ncbi:MAG: hypothetical protein JRJ14_07570 [Deltaproteobacteria bacterium]|nr:hypothetical protein [Deltaproteobacteria bacterium]
MEDFEDFENFDENPLDLDGDGDDAMEMCLFFDDDDKKNKGSKPPGSSGCCVVLLAIGSSLAGARGISYFIT